VPAQAEHLRWGKPDLGALDLLCEQLKFGPLTRSRCRALTP